MIYEHTAQNLISLMKSIPMATEEQLQMFFSRSLEPMKVSDIIKQLVLEHRLIRQIQSGKYEVLTVIRPIRFSKRAVDDFLDAFWVIANMGAENVRYIVACNDATKYAVVLEDGSTNDITVCQTAEDARVGQLTRDLQGEEDDITHIALCYSVEAGEAMKSKLKAYGYDTYCVVDERTHKVKYYDVEE